MDRARGSSTLRRELEANIRGGRCVYCRRPASAEEPLTREHVIPRGEGGRRKDVRIIVPACAACNHRRGCRELCLFLLLRPRRISAFLDYLGALSPDSIQEMDLRVFAELYAAVWMLTECAERGREWREQLRRHLQRPDPPPPALRGAPDGAEPSAGVWSSGAPGHGGAERPRLPPPPLRWRRGADAARRAAGEAGGEARWAPLPRLAGSRGGGAPRARPRGIGRPERGRPTPRSRGGRGPPAGRLEATPSPEAHPGRSTPRSRGMKHGNGGGVRMMNVKLNVEC